LDGIDNDPEEDEEDTDFDEDDASKETTDVEYSLRELSAFFRELDYPVFMLLNEKLVFEPKPIEGEETTSEFGPGELMLLLEDYHQKLDHALDKKPGLFSAKK